MTFKRIVFFFLLLLLALVLYGVYLDYIVRQQFEGKRFELPARVYARPLELFVGMALTPQQLRTELELLKYTSTPDPSTSGQYSQQNDVFLIYVRAFDFWDGAQEEQQLRIEIRGSAIASLVDAETNQGVDIARLDPVGIGGIYPSKGEDRELVRLEQVPESLINALLAIEDHRFYSHHGVDPRAILRALTTLIGRGRIQGGSTITQQLVKNFFLTPERTLRRKLTEMLMALLLEWRYSKNDILETYLNEVYLGQDRNRAIHGFGLASQFYFNRSIEQLELHQAALLVGMLKGPVSYNPRQHAQRALTRRNLVLAELSRRGYIDKHQYDALIQRSLDISPKPNMGLSPYPAFMDLVVRQLRSDYDEDDLRTEGLRIFTTLDPIAQRAAERTLTKRLGELEQQHRLSANTLEGALVMIHSQSGEVNVVVGGRRPRFEGFNRALDAARQIGSLFKPAIYLTALQQPERYTLVTLLDDSELLWQEPGIEDWQPSNYNNQYHGEVPLWLALAKSYNVSAARLGLDLGIQNIIETANKLGLERNLSPYASTLLGTAELTPMEVAQMYHTIASGGFRTPFRAIRAVMTIEGKPLKRYGLAVKQTLAPEPVYLLSAALQGVVREGTGKGLQHYLSPALNVAGKTGTTDGLRDSWFAGFTGDRVAVVWVGSDHNQSTGFTGAAGAMTVWGEVLSQLNPRPLTLPQPEGIEIISVDPLSGLRVDANCQEVLTLPFVGGSAPKESVRCTSVSGGNKIKNWFKRIFSGE